MSNQIASNEASDVENRKPSHVGLSALLGGVFYYMRDDHCFARLSPVDADEFVRDIRRQFDLGFTGGMVCGSLHGQHIAEVVHAHGSKSWDEFENEARRWFACQQSQLCFDPIAMGA